MRERSDSAGAPVANADASIAAARDAARWRLAMARWSRHVSRPAELLLDAMTLLREGLPVGLLRRHEIEHAVWQAYTDAHDFYVPHSVIRYENELVPLLERHTEGKRLLDLYCGQGREAAIFAGRGYCVTGVDAQAWSIEAARAHADRAGFEARFEVGDVDVWEPRDGPYDVVYTSLWMYTTIPDEQARIAWLRRLAAWVAPGGVLVVSVTPLTAGRKAAVRHAVARVVAAITFNSRRPELGDRFHTELFWHDFTLEMAHRELALAGLEPLDSHAIRGATPCTFHIVRPLADRAEPPADDSALDRARESS